MSDSHEPSLGRRAAVRLLIWGAAGLSLLPSCRRRPRVSTASPPPPAGSGTPPQPAGTPGVVAKWAELGRVWREMGAYVVSGEVDLDRRRGLEELKGEMDAALDAVSASPELRAAFEGRWEWIDLPYAMEDRLQQEGMACYQMVQMGSLLSGPEIEKQVEELRALEAEGTLSEEALRKAAAVLALHAEYLARDQEAREGDGETDRDARSALLQEMDAAQLQPGPSATEAGERLVELTVDDLGRLAGPPQENEGVEGPAPGDDEEADQ